jgi:hypothetical protein
MTSNCNLRPRDWEPTRKSTKSFTCEGFVSSVVTEPTTVDAKDSHTDVTCETKSVLWQKDASPCTSDRYPYFFSKAHRADACQNCGLLSLCGPPPPSDRIPRRMRSPEGHFDTSTLSTFSRASTLTVSLSSLSWGIRKCVPYWFSGCFGGLLVRRRLQRLVKIRDPRNEFGKGLRICASLEGVYRRNPNRRKGSTPLRFSADPKRWCTNMGNS